MELRDFAEQVLFATTLEEKLRCPQSVTDEHPGAPLALPLAPGRPSELRFKASDGGKSDFPGVHRLDQEPERGRLLHFFANHELLATELMALVLLRFPQAPAAFRRGVLQTLKDEQLHTRLYLDRMKECGIQFGDLPVSGYFWRSVSRMESPMDYVAGLSLTFEQANLDFCRHFASGFDRAGDPETARLLERIYRDEIGHVAYGLKWFRRWKNPQQTDWDAFCRQLKFPLSPQRAKGTTLNVQGRRAAGFDPAFIAQLNVYSRSKGRTPNVFVFNPFAEAFIAHGKSFTPVKHQALLARDLANLSQFLCRQDDLVLLEKHPSVEFLSALKQAGFPLPEFAELKAGCVESSGELAPRKVGKLRPWAWGPDSLELLAPLFPNVTAEKRQPQDRFNNKIAELYSKTWSAVFLRKVLARSSRGNEALIKKPAIGNRNSELDQNLTPAASEPWLCTENEVGVAVTTVETALEAITAIRRRGHHRLIAKESLGLAGHNSIRLWEPELLDSQRRWMANGLGNGRQLVIEPWLERVLDFSIQLEMGPDGLKLCGYTGLINDRKGQYQANWAEANCHRRIPAAVGALFRDRPEVASGFERFYANVFAPLGEELRRAGYLGPVGIDAFVYRAPEGGCRLKPIVEINPRYTMGRLTVELMNRASPGSHGLFRLVNRAMARAEGFEDFPAYARALAERFPLRLEGEPSPKIREGALCLNDPATAQVCLAVFHVSRNLDTLLAPFSD